MTLQSDVLETDTPALVVNGKVEIKGRVPSLDEIKEVLKKY